MGNKRQEAGWSIIELIFILMLISSIIWIVLPNVIEFGERSEQEMLLQMLSSELHLAQMEAVSRGEAVRLQFAKDKIQVIQADRLIRETEIPIRYHIKTNYPQSAIVFQQTGQVRGGTIQLWRQERLVARIKVQVASGRPKVELFFQ